MHTFFHVVIRVVGYLLEAFLLLLIVRLIVELVQQFARSWRPARAVAVLLEIVFTITDPPLKALRRLLPPLRIGTIAFDVAFPVLFLIVYILIIVVGRLPA